MAAAMGRHDGDPVALAEPFDAVAQRDDLAGIFVAQHRAVLHAEDGITVCMQIAAANAAAARP